MFFRRSVLVPRPDMLQHIEREDAVVASRDRPSERVVLEHREVPARHHPRLDVLQKYRVEVGSAEALHVLLHDARSEGIAAADLEHVLGSREHFRDKLVAREPKQQVLRLLVPALARPQPQPLEAAAQGSLDALLVLRLATLQLPALRIGQSVLGHGGIFGNLVSAPGSQRSLPRPTMLA